MKSQYVCIKMATLLGGKLYVKTSNMLYVDHNGQVVFIVNKKYIYTYVATITCKYVI